MFNYVARQAIYDHNKNVFAYELLFRDGIINCFPNISQSEATSNILAGSHLSIGVENITDNRPAFINFHTDSLLYRFPSSLDPLNVIIEIVETVDITDELIAACQHIANLGYKIALDDYDFSEKWDALIPLAQYIKIEVSDIDFSNSRKKTKIDTLIRSGKTLIAERVETLTEFEELKRVGFDLFQGYFLSKPEVVKHRNIEINLTSIIELVDISVSKEFNYEKINNIFEKDVGLSYKLMRFINNPLFNKRQRIDSLSHALKYLGEVELKKFIALIALASLKGEKPIDLVYTSLCRAQFCKLIATEMKLTNETTLGFVIGLFSLVDALIDLPMPEVMNKMPFSDEAKKVLCHQDHSGSLALQFQLCLAIEIADWDAIDLLAKKTNLTLPIIFTKYYESMEWANEMKTLMS